MPRINLPLAGRSFERTQGCWNCIHRATPDASLAHWTTAVRPNEDARLAQMKTAVLAAASNADVAAIARITTAPMAPCPCGRGQPYKHCHYPEDKRVAPIVKQIVQIEQLAAKLDAFEAAIKAQHPYLGLQGLCDNPRVGGYKAHNYLCEQWSAAPGASLAREGQRADPLPEELKAIHGDGND